MAITVLSCYLMAMDDDAPPLSMASENTDADVRKSEAIRMIEWPTREMAANLLRVMRGAGRPHELPQQLIDLAGAIIEASKLSNAWGIWSEMEQWLQSAVPNYADRDDFDDHRPPIVRGSLQICASRLVYQMMQASAGEREMMVGIREREDRLEQRRSERAEQAARERTKPTRPK